VISFSQRPLLTQHTTKAQEKSVILIIKRPQNSATDSGTYVRS